MKEAEITPQISVVMSCFNSAGTVGAAIDSILNQTYHDFEFIIVNDCSEDNIGDILLEYQKRDDRIKILHNEKNAGLAYSLNKGIKIAKGRFIARMDADDISHPDRFQLQKKYLDTHPVVDVLGTSAILIDLKGNHLGFLDMPREHAEIIKLRYKNALFIHPSVMAKRSFFIENNYYDESLKRAQDADLWIRAMDQSTFNNLPNYLLDYTVKRGISFDILKYTSLVKWKNMKNRDEVLSHGFILVKSFIRFILIKFMGWERGPFREKYSQSSNEG